MFCSTRRVNNKNDSRNNSKPTSENKITICICDHQARDLLACVDMAMILSNGKIVALDTPSNLVNDIKAKNAYFGDNFKFN